MVMRVRSRSRRSVRKVVANVRGTPRKTAVVNRTATAAAAMVVKTVVETVNAAAPAKDRRSLIKARTARHVDSRVAIPIATQQRALLRQKRWKQTPRVHSVNPESHASLVSLEKTGNRVILMHKVRPCRRVNNPPQSQR